MPPYLGPYGGVLVLVIAAFLAKCLLVLATASGISKRVSDPVGRMLAAWILVQAGMTVTMLTLSFRSMLSQHTALLVVSLSIVGSSLVLRRRAAWPTLTKEWKWSIPFLLVLGLIMVRSRLFPDFTWDAQTYGLVRFAFWIQEESILGYQLIPQINIFTNEWNGELISLFYGLVSHNLQGTMMGGVEVLTLTYLSTLYLARLISGSVKWHQITATIATATPATLGLTSVVKGDLLAVVSVVMASAWAINTIRTKDRVSMALCAASSALAIGSKISTLISVVLIAMTVILLCYRTVNMRTLAAAICSVLVFDLRFFLNFIQYGHFVVRVGGEHPDFSFSNLANNATLIWRSILSFEFQALGQQFGSWSLQGGLCLTGIVAIGAFTAAVCLRLSMPLIAFAATGGSIAAASLYPEYPWNFRYFLPGIIVLIVCAISRMRCRGYVVTTFIVLSVPIVNCAYVFIPGEMNGGSTFFHAASYLLSTPDPIRRTFLPDLTRGIHTDFDIFSAKRLDHVSIFQEVDTMILPFFGSRLSNKIELASSEEAFRKTLNDTGVQAAIYTFNGVTSDPERVGTIMTQAGFDVIKRDEQYVIGLRPDLINEIREDPALAPQFASGIQWFWGQYDMEGMGKSAFMWMRDKAEFAVKTDQVSCVHLDLESPLVPNQRVSARQNGREIGSHAIERPDAPRMTWDLTVVSDAAWTTVELTAESPAAHAPPDPRSLAYLVHLPVVVDVGSACPTRSP